MKFRFLKIIHSLTLKYPKIPRNTQIYLGNSQIPKGSENTQIRDIWVENTQLGNADTTEYPQYPILDCTQSIQYYCVKITHEPPLNV